VTARPSFILNHATLVLDERREALQDALMTKAWHERKRTSAKLDCGCAGKVEQKADEGGAWKEWVWTEQCELHQAAERIVG
jgi:hypothetical protein